MQPDVFRGIKRMTTRGLHSLIWRAQNQMAQRKLFLDPTGTKPTRFREKIQTGAECVWDIIIDLTSEPGIYGRKMGGKWEGTDDWQLWLPGSSQALYGPNIYCQNSESWVELWQFLPGRDSLVKGKEQELQKASKDSRVTACELTQ